MKRYQVEITIALIIYIVISITAIYYCIQFVSNHYYINAFGLGILPLTILPLFDIFQRRYQRAKKKQRTTQQTSPEATRDTIEPD